jgi:hypothetical protein
VNLQKNINARVAEFQNQYASNLAGRTGPSLPASARNPFYPVYAARGGRIGFEGGGIGNIIKQVTQQSFFNQPSNAYDGKWWKNEICYGKLC